MNPLTNEQRLMAEKNHDLVYTFLQEKRLPESIYYDVVIFGYLCAVQEYSTTPSLQKYSFATVAWKKMNCAVKNHLQYLNRQKRAIPTVSLNDCIGNDEDSFCFEDIISIDDSAMQELELDLILHSLASSVPKKQMRIIRMKLDGDSMHDIAKKEHMTFHDINHLLNGTRETVIKVLWG